MARGWKRWTRERVPSLDMQDYIQDQVILWYASATVRDVELTDPTQGMVCYLADRDCYVQHTGTGWRYLAGQGLGAAVSTATEVDLAEGWSSTIGSVRRVGRGLATLYLEVVRTGSAIAVPADGNVAPNVIGTVAVPWRPSVSIPVMSTAAGPLASGWLAANGTLNLGAVAPGTALNNTTTLALTVTPYPVTDPLLLP